MALTHIFRIAQTVEQMKTTRTFSEVVGWLHESHLKACDAVEALHTLTEKLLQSARKSETVDALNALQENLNSIMRGLESAEHKIRTLNHD